MILKRVSSEENKIADTLSRKRFKPNKYITMNVLISLIKHIFLKVSKRDNVVFVLPCFANNDLSISVFFQYFQKSRSLAKKNPVRYTEVFY